MSNRDAYLPVKLTPELKERLRVHAEKSQLSMSWWGMRYIQEGLDRDAPEAKKEPEEPKKNK